MPSTVFSDEHRALLSVLVGARAEAGLNRPGFAGGLMA